jgi:electron transfer flavoprotein alpha/beta subunit
MKAKKKPMRHWTLSDIDLNIDEINRLSTIDVIKVQVPKVERKKIVLKADTIEELAERFVEAIEMEGIVEK